MDLPTILVSFQVTSADEFVWIDSHNRLVEVNAPSSNIFVVNFIINRIHIVIFGFLIVNIVPSFRCNSCLGPAMTW